MEKSYVDYQLDKGVVNRKAARYLGKRDLRVVW